MKIPKSPKFKFISVVEIQFEPVAEENHELLLRTKIVLVGKIDIEFLKTLHEFFFGKYYSLV